MTKIAHVGIIGCGMISSIYLKNLQAFSSVKVLACADIDLERAKAQAERFEIPFVSTVEELLANSEIAIVLNLTIPQAHAEVGLAALRANKHLYSEKPLAISRAEGKRLLEAGEAGNLRVGCAPDTFLGGGLQTCIELINQGAIGTPVAATAFMAGHGHESWHPDPEFYYQKGGGGLFSIWVPTILLP